MICELDDEIGSDAAELIEACDRTDFTASELEQLLNVISLKVSNAFLDYAGADEVIQELLFAAKGLHRISNGRK